MTALIDLPHEFGPAPYDAPAPARSSSARAVTAAGRLAVRSALGTVDTLLSALAAPHHVDRYLELLHPRLTVRELRGRIMAVRRTTEDTVTLTIRPNRHWQGFRAGQFVQVSLDIDGVVRTRCYSPISSQHRSTGDFELTVKAHADGVVSSHLNEHAIAGTVVRLSQAGGAFTLPDPRPERILLISGGSGITPVLSMARTLVDESRRGRYRGEIVFLHYGRTEATVAHLAELRELAEHCPSLRLVLAYPGSDDDTGDLAGYFSAAHLYEAAPWHAEAQTFLCGPAGLMRSVRACYADAGLTERLHFEEFTPPSRQATAAPEAEAEAGQLRFLRSNIDSVNDGTTLLEQAEAAGLDPAYGCRMGICFTCSTVKKQGYTRNLLTGDLDTEEDSTVQLCISVPVGDVTVQL
ncbi:ferredoxin reductase [Jatrophihabitans telluris]|uniref:Ferredoxin reductase n=1 Tax=Jatrophihabitans telluris TaxID=2038343 RepID=A0ABY4QWE6_9ACTN|nr:ferredoxin reductase [Jatrophihabitans telluris]UQX87366.1 ferredoxin reductase [Jatrophihabitans telluris]